MLPIGLINSRRLSAFVIIYTYKDHQDQMVVLNTAHLYQKIWTMATLLLLVMIINKTSNS